MTASSKRKRASKNRGGRPTRAAASAKALAALAVDPETIKPREILAGIAADTSAPATARVAACRALLQQAEGDNGDKPDDDPITTLALKLLAGKSK